MQNLMQSNGSQQGSNQVFDSIQPTENTDPQPQIKIQEVETIEEFVMSKEKNIAPNDLFHLKCKIYAERNFQSKKFKIPPFCKDDPSLTGKKLEDEIKSTNVQIQLCPVFVHNQQRMIVQTWECYKFESNGAEIFKYTKTLRIYNQDFN